VKCDDDRVAEATFGRAETLRALGDLAEGRGEREEVRERHAEALHLLSNLLPRNPDLIRPRIAHSFLQIARMDALTDRPEAEHTFRVALQVAESPEDNQIRSVVWHYLGAYCERRRLPIASFLAHQQSLDELPEDAPTSELLSQLRDQLRALQDLQEIEAALAIVRLIERHGALVDDSATVVSSEQIIAQMGLPNDRAVELSTLLDKPANIAALRDETIARMRAAVPDFARRFEAGELSLGDTASVALPQEPPPAAGVAEGLGLLETAAEQARAWRFEAEDTFRTALRTLGNAADYALAYGWDRVGAYLLGRAQPVGALLAYNAALDAAESAGKADPTNAHSYAVIANGALHGAAYALADLGDTYAQLACIAILERRGSLDGFPTIEQLLANQDLTGWQRRRLHRKLLDDDRTCRRSLSKAVSRAARELPDFERRFIAGEERFDSPERLLRVLRAPVRNPRTREIGAAGVRRFYRRRLKTRILVPALVLAGACGALLTLGAASWPWPVKVALGVGGLIYVAIWIGSVRAIHRWVRATRPTADDRLIDDLDREASTHTEAYAIVERFARDRTPFALYLRSFDIEANETVMPIANARRWQRSERANAIERAVMQGISPSAAVAGLVSTDQWLISRLGSPSDVDAYLGERLARHLAVIGVFNPAAMATRMGRVPRLELSHNAWEMGVRLLVSSAHLIVVECFRLTPGVLTELELIENRERAPNTVIVLPSAKTVADLDELQTLAELAGASTTTSDSEVPGIARVDDARRTQIVARDSQALHAFARVIDEDSLLADDPSALDVFAGLLPSDDDEDV
jgi:hypothetical protein